MNSHVGGDQWRRDEQVIQAKRQLVEALARHQGRITGIRPPDPHQRAAYAKIVQEAGAVRGRPLVLPYLGTGFGKGALVELLDGSVKYDFITGIGVHAFGHSHPTLVEAAIDAALSDTIMQGNLMQNRESVLLAGEVLDVANRNHVRFQHCFLTTSGAMANENALKLAFHKKRPADRILAFHRSFAGRTMVLSHITDRPEYRQGLPTMAHVDYVPFFDADDPKASIARSVGVLREHLRTHPGGHAVMIFELIQGEGGVYVGTREFFVSLMAILREHEIPVMIDEIQTFGRTTEPFAFQHFGLHEYTDVVTVGKMLQVCATIFSSELNPNGSLLSQTFTGSASAVFAARAILRELLHGGYFGDGGKIAKLGGYFIDRLAELERKYPHAIAGPYGFGGMTAFTPFDGDAKKAEELVRRLFDAGVICFVGGHHPARVRFLMPFGAITLDDIDAVARILDETIDEMSGSTISP